MNGAEVTVECFAIHDNARVGLLVGGNADFRQSTAFFKNGNVTGHVIDVSVASGWMGLDRDFDNQANLSSSEIRLPSMSILPGGG